MFLKNYKPKTPTLRFKRDIFKMTPFIKKNNIFFIKNKNKSGRSTKGQIIVRHRGANKYNKHLSINVNRNQLTNLAIITSLNYINKNSCFIGLIKYSNNCLSYIKLANGLFIGNYTKSLDKPLNFSFNFRNILGSFIILNLAPKHSIFSNLISFNKKKSNYAKSAGTFLSIIKKIKEINLFILKLPTGEKKYFSGDSKATLGRNSNFLNKFTVTGKAGINRNKGWRSSVRGVAMNPVDHPHGGRTKTNQPEMSPWGWITKKNK
uniref:Ribosomal protein L2 n=1 Tax=Tetrahymena thermophila TaxID=5911 RepID=Q951B6_TETTH|nr:ribosomal protein L2 [Tetrahymena thermophila]AAK77567.1 ribosomal protein L2 [Tetrahymena thermophila]6Z1P_Ac Chain Ac, Ribosomal protein L2 [Tetrahymena thermophila SB210]